MGDLADVSIGSYYATVPKIAPYFDPNESYSEGDIVSYQGATFIFTQSHTGAWNGNHAQQTTLAEQIQNGGGDGGGCQTTIVNVVSTYDPDSQTYAHCLDMTLAELEQALTCGTLLAHEEYVEGNDVEHVYTALHSAFITKNNGVITGGSIAFFGPGCTQDGAATCESPYSANSPNAYPCQQTIK